MSNWLIVFCILFNLPSILILSNTEESGFIVDIIWSGSSQKIYFLIRVFKSYAFNIIIDAIVLNLPSDGGQFFIVSCISVCLSCKQVLIVLCYYLFKEFLFLGRQSQAWKTDNFSLQSKEQTLLTAHIKNLVLQIQDFSTVIQLTVCISCGLSCIALWELGFGELV